MRNSSSLLGFAVEANKSVFGGAAEVCFVEEAQQGGSVEVEVVVCLGEGDQAGDGAADGGVVFHVGD